MRASISRLWGRSRTRPCGGQLSAPSSPASELGLPSKVRTTRPRRIGDVTVVVRLRGQRDDWRRRAAVRNDQAEWVRGLWRSLAFGQIWSPPCLACSKQLPTTTYQTAASEPEREIRMRRAWNWRRATANGAIRPGSAPAGPGPRQVHRLPDNRDTERPQVGKSKALR